jgi:hypothetical protein
MPNEKQAKIIEQFQKALEAGREAKTNGEIAVSVKLHQGGIRDAQVTIQRQVV